MGQIKLVSGLVMSILFVLALTVFAINFGVDNDASVLLSSDEDYANIQNDLTGQIQDFNSDSNTSINTLMATTQEAGDQSASSGGQFKVGALTALDIATGMVTVGFVKIFGQDTGFGVFLTALLSVIAWTLGLYIWKSWRGNPD